jgi:ubiquinone/menaquinone biosynthesis C-methylase UbiE
MYVRLIRWAFARFYREFAWTYDTVAALVSAGQWRMWALAALPYLRGRVLELGCGTGNLQRALAEPGRPATIGLDASPQMIGLARSKVERSGGTARLVRGDARALPFPLASFDTLVATFPSEYIAAQPTIDEARRVLRPGGQLVIILAAQLAGAGLYERLVELLYRLTLQRSPGLAPPNAPPRSRLARALAQAGFEVRERWEPAADGQVQLHMIFGDVATCPQPSSKS